MDTIEIESGEMKSGDVAIETIVAVKTGEEVGEELAEGATIEVAE